MKRRDPLPPGAMADEVLCLCGAWLPFVVTRPETLCFVARPVRCGGCGTIAIITWRASPAGFSQPPESVRYLRGLDLVRCSFLHLLAKRGGVAFTGSAHAVDPPIEPLIEWIHGEGASERVLH